MNMRRSEIGLKLHKSLWRFLNVHAARINLGTVSGAEHRLCGAAPVTCALAMVFRLDGDDDALGYLDRLGERRNVERARVDCSYRVIKALRPSEPFAPFVGVLKLCMEAPLYVKAAINLSDDFQRNGRPCFKLMPTLVGSDTAPDLDRPGLTNRSDEVHALHTAPTLLADAFRSEEHTSELQSLMRISYAVFCFKKKNCIVKYKYIYTTKLNTLQITTKENKPKNTKK